MDALHANLFAAFDVDVEVVHEDGFLRLHPKLLQGNLEDLRFGLDRTHLRRDDHLVEGIVEFFPDDKVAQVAPGVRDESCFIFAAQRADVLDQRPVDDIAGKEFVPDTESSDAGRFNRFMTDAQWSSAAISPMDAFKPLSLSKTILLRSS